MVDVVRSTHEYEDLLGQWSDLESGLGIILSNPDSTQEFAHRVLQYDRWMQGLMHRDPDTGLYLLFQLAGNSPVGYSASHALVCATLCHIITKELGTSAKERDSLVHAALTMNIAMTQLQDELANQIEKPTPAQQDRIYAHAIKGGMMLSNLGVEDALWLDIVSSHHPENSAAAAATGEYVLALPTLRLVHILKVVDRYAAMISPRMSRAGRSSTESARAVLANTSAKIDDVAYAMVRAVGLCPPGTFVRMDTGDLGVVVRRSSAPNQPYVAIVGRPDGDLLTMPRLHRTSNGSPRIRTALAAATVHANLNHFHILQLTA